MTAQAQPAAERLRRVGPVEAFLTRPAAGAALIAVVVWIAFAIVAGGRGFLSLAGTLGYLDVAAQVGIIGSAVALLMIAGEFDLSVGSMVGFSGMIIAIAIGEFGLPTWLGVALAFAAALGIGFLNGLIVVRTRLPSFIVTLAALFILRGVTIGLTRFITGRTQVFIPREATAGDPVALLFTWQAGDFKVSILWWIAVAVVAAFVLGRTRFGNWIFGVGGSAVAARNLGVPVARVKISLFMATAASAALLASVQVLTFSGADALRGEGKELEAITTAVIGGTLLTGGYGSVVGTAIGALALGMASNGIFFAGIASDWYKAAIGVLLLGSVLFNDIVRRRIAEARR